MGLLFDRSKLKHLLEVEVDGQPVEGDDPNQAPEDYTDSPDPAAGGEQPPVEEVPPQEEEQDPNMPPPEEAPPEDYNDEYGGEDGGGGEAQGSEPPPPEEEAPVDNIKQQEEELYNELTPEQLDIKHKELKTQFLNMYDEVVAIIDRIGDVNVAEENIGTIEYVSNTLANLKDMLSDYMNTVYKTKSYFENSINYNRFLAVLGGINKVLEEMNSKNA